MNDKIEANNWLVKTNPIENFHVVHDEELIAHNHKRTIILLWRICRFNLLV